ncbi:MAG TPA: 3-octaprenyl-4-hydroxybenzoate carboxy-lyase [Planctomycetaceae bacterium]|nr:3-octaprenyl-4-hydroxybenzoate carboxy-lyase [Planctomycetaceae bacterium]HRF01092.1 flavin prenyltransferase UbiX [Pirellulaceae bacterium]
MRPIVVGVTGASGAAYARRLVQVLVRSGREVELVISASGREVFLRELKLDPLAARPQGLIETFGLTADEVAERIRLHGHGDFLAPIASGSHRTAGMVICPCSGTTLGGIVTGTGGNLIQRAAEVHLKERRKLILVPRETPVSLVHLDNLRAAHQAGAIVLPASPGWYHGVTSLDDLIDFIVARILDQLEVEHRLMRRWGDA